MKKYLLTVLAILLLIGQFGIAQAQWKKEEEHAAKILNASLEQKKHYAQVFMRTFMNLCISGMSKPENLRTYLKDAVELSPEMAKLFLNNESGNAWVLENNLENGFQILALRNDIYYCSVQTMSAEPAEVEELFNQFTSNSPEWGEFSLLKDELSTENDGNTVHQTSFLLNNKESNVVIQLTLITNSMAKKNRPQGIISMLIDRIV